MALKTLHDTPEFAFSDRSQQIQKKELSAGLRTTEAANQYLLFRGLSAGARNVHAPFRERYRVPVYPGLFIILPFSGRKPIALRREKRHYILSLFSPGNGE
jgi:hypothetical protein